MNKTIKIILISVIFIIAALLRLYKFDQIPISPDWDEAAIGYNAYSILKTGKDEYGTFLPFTFRSFNDYKPPLYIYLTVPFIKIFGLTVFSVRMVSVLSGLASVIGVYLLSRILLDTFLYQRSKNRKDQYLLNLLNDSVPLVSAGLLAISPWHIQFSRPAFEANLGVALNIWVFYFFFKSLKHPKFWFLTSIFTVLSLYAYHAERVFIPLMLILLTLSFRDTLNKHKKHLVLPVIIGIMCSIPIIVGLFNQSSLERLSGTSAFNKQFEILQRSTKKLEWDKQHGYILGELLNNRRFEWIKTITASYLSHFSLRWLTITGDLQRHHAPDMGLLYVWEVPFILLGLLVLLKINSNLCWFFIGWILIAPIAAAFTYETPHAVRTLVFLPVYQILEAPGLILFLRKCFEFIKNKKIIPKLIGISSILIFVGIICFNFLYYLDKYFILMNYEYAQYWQYGYKEAYEYTASHIHQYDKIIVSDTLEEPYIFYLFYSAYDPETYIKFGGSNKKQIGKYEFRPIRWDQETQHGNILYVTKPNEVDKINKLIINYPDGKPAIGITN